MPHALPVVNGTHALPHALPATVCITLTATGAAANAAQASRLALSHDAARVDGYVASAIAICFGLHIGLTLRRDDLNLHLSALPEDRIDARANGTTRSLGICARLIGVSRVELGGVNRKVVSHASASVEHFRFHLKRDVD
jgi:hypothetical protein